MSGYNLKDVIEDSSGSGSGPCFLIQKTIAKQLSFKRLIGQGEFSGNSIWLAEWNGQPVAVKVFPTSNESSWDREREIFNTVLLRHPNILGYISSDIRGKQRYNAFHKLTIFVIFDNVAATGYGSERILITEYFNAGSLRDFLKHNDIDPSTLVSQMKIHIHISMDVQRSSLSRFSQRQFSLRCFSR